VGNILLVHLGTVPWLPAEQREIWSGGIQDAVGKVTTVDRNASSVLGKKKVSFPPENIGIFILVAHQQRTTPNTSRGGVKEFV